MILIVEAKNESKNISNYFCPLLIFIYVFVNSLLEAFELSSHHSDDLSKDY